MSVVVGSPGLPPSVAQLARALSEAGLLARLEGSIAYLPERASHRLLSRIAQLIIGSGAEAQLRRRLIDDIPANKIRLHPLNELLRIAIGRTPLGEDAAHWLWEQGSTSFDRSVAASLSPADSVVLGTEFSSRATFRRARKLGIRTVFYAGAPHHRAVDATIDREIVEHRDLNSEFFRRMVALRSRHYAHKEEELRLADRILVNSRVTAGSLVDAGISPATVNVIPLGCPDTDASWEIRPVPKETTLIFAGNISILKGAHHLLDAWHRTRSEAGRGHLHLFGRWLLPTPVSKWGVHVTHHGNVPRSTLFKGFIDADALIMPTLLDGFGMVVTEALAHGLPIVTTSACGAADLLTEGTDGFVVPVGDMDALAARLRWCLDHPEKLRAMRPAAAAAAMRNPWSLYRERVAAFFRELSASHRKSVHASK